MPKSKKRRSNSWISAGRKCSGSKYKAMGFPDFKVCRSTTAGYSKSYKAARRTERVAKKKDRGLKMLSAREARQLATCARWTKAREAEFDRLSKLAGYRRRSRR